MLVLHPTLILTEKSCRAFPFIRDMFAFDALITAAVGHLNGYNPLEHSAVMQKVCRAAGCTIAASLDGYVESINSGVFPDEIRIQFLETETCDQQQLVRGISSISARNDSANFALYTEIGCDWIKRNVATDYHRWPPVANFCRVARNAIVHGRINIKSQTAPEVSWRGVKISHLSDGKNLFDTELISLGDLIVIMLELDAELEELGAPFLLD